MASELLEIVSLSLYVSGVALLIASLLGVPCGALVGLSRFRGKRFVALLFFTGMAFPPVVIGLLVYMLLSRAGWLGGLELAFLPSLFTPAAMILAQVIIAFPLVAGFTMAAVMGVDPQLRLQVAALGADRRQVALAVLDEARLGVVAAVIAGFGGIISEVGAVMLVGGNIAGRTRVLSTAIVLETRQGQFSLALWLGAVLIGLTLISNLIMMRLQGRAFDD